MPGLLQEMMQDHKAHEAEEEDETDSAKVVSPKDVAPTEAKATIKIFQDEGRETGAVSWSMYRDYAKSMASPVGLFFFFLLLLFTMACNVGTTLLLGFWSGETIPGFQKGHYIAVYGGKFSESERQSHV